MPYVDGYLLAVPAANKAAYAEAVRRMWDLLRAEGALSMWECWGDEVPEGKVTSFPMAVRKKEDEVVVFAWTVWPDKATRDRGGAAVMAALRATGEDASAMPFDGTRIIYGGFEPLVVGEAPSPET